MTGWGMFWLFMLVFFMVDLTLFNKGYNTFFWSYKTEAELQDQRHKLGLPKLAVSQSAEELAEVFTKEELAGMVILLRGELESVCELVEDFKDE